MPINFSSPLLIYAAPRVAVQSQKRTICTHFPLLLHLLLPIPRRPPPTPTLPLHPLTLPPHPLLLLHSQPLLLLSCQPLLLHLMHLAKFLVPYQQANTQPHGRNNHVINPHHPKGFRVNLICDALLLRGEVFDDICSGASGAST